MARIKDVVDECLLVAGASTAIGSKAYNELGSDLWENNDRTFPFMLVDKKSVNGVVDSFSRTNFPSSETYSQRFHFFDTYDESEKSSTDVQTKEDGLMVIAEQYFTELRTRTESGAKGFYLVGLTFNVDDEKHTNRLVEISYDVEFIAKRETCTAGSFVYSCLVGAAIVGDCIL